MDKASVVTTRGGAPQWWLVLPWVLGGVVLVARLSAHLLDSDALDAVSPLGVAIVALGAGMLLWGPVTMRARSAAALVVVAGALLWFADVTVGRADPGQPHRGVWFALGLASVVACFGLVVAVGALARSERALWQPSGFLGRR